MSTTKTSDTESNNMAVNIVIQKKKLTVFEFFPIDFNHIETSLFTLFQVELKEENSKHALFRLMPRYKVKAEGDVVRLFTMGNSHAVI